MKIAFAAIFVILATLSFAVTPQFWEVNSQEAFAAGDPQSVSINSDGELLLAPQLKRIYEGSDALIWKILEDHKGNILAATGNDGRILRIDRAGVSTVALDTAELEVQAMVLDKNDVLYAATSPDGKIYEVKDGKSRVFFDPEDKYIWCLTMDSAGNLYAGTGPQGRVYKIDSQGKGAVLLDTKESNITALAWDSTQALLAGSDRNGILYRIDSNGKAFVLYDADAQQITSIYPAADGSIYFAAVNAQPGMQPVSRPVTEPAPTQPTPQIPPAESPAQPSPNEPEGVVSVEVSPVMPAIPITPQPAGPLSSVLYRLTSNGYVETMYSSFDDQILDIVGYGDNRVLLATGKKARLIVVDPEKKSTILLKTSEEQLTSLLHSGEKLLAASSNPGNIYEVVESHAAQGTYVSDVKDTQATSAWGQIRWKAEVPKGTALTLSTRSGNTRTPDETWTAWQSAGSDPAGAQVQNTRARFIQWKADFTATDPKATPVLRSVSIAYLQQNLRPEIQTVTVYPAGAVFRAAQSFSEDFAGMVDGDVPDQDAPDAGQPAAVTFNAGTTLGKKEYRRGYRTITWTASDPNQDDLRYDILFRESSEKTWRPLAHQLKEQVFAWDTQTIPDGTYSIKVVASDSPSNPGALSLTNYKESESFDVDNTAPKIEVVKKSVEGKKTVLEVRASDQFSTISDMEYAVNPGEWVVVFPVDLINDSTSENYRIEIENAPPGGSVVLKCTDRVKNTATIRYAF